MKAIVFDRSGLPPEVLELREINKPLLAAGKVMVKMLSAPINPGDFLFIQSLYPDPKKPSFPGQVAGNGGAGVIVEKGPGTSLAEGTLVAAYHYNTWAEYAVFPEEWLIPLPADLPLEKAGQLMSLITAWDLVEATKAKAGDWIALTAGNSTVAIMTMQIAARKGIRVISLVRKQPSLDLRALGADQVIDLSFLGEDTVETKARGITGNKGISAIIDAVGGSVLADLVHSASPGARVIIYGGASEQRFELHNFDILMKGLTIESYIYRHFFTPPIPEEKETIRNIIDMISDPSFITPIGGRYRLDEYKTAIQNSFYSTAGSTSGKGLFIIG
jgi:NADPH:quinone reductase